MQVKDHFLTQEIFEVKQIQEGIKQTLPQPKDLVQYYDSTAYISHHQDSLNLKILVYKLFQKLNLRYKKSILDSVVTTGNKILDYGCGVGDFIAYLQPQYQVLGYEPSLIARETAEKKVGYKHIIHNLNEVKDDSLDAVSLWHVFEHLAEPENFLQEIYTKLKSCGILIIAVPNYKSYDAQYYKSYWAAYDVPRHLFHYAPSGIKSLLDSSHWNLKKSKPLYFDAFYISMLSEKYRKNSFSALKGSFVGAISNFKALKTGYFSSMIYIIEKI